MRGSMNELLIDSSWKFVWKSLKDAGLCRNMRKKIWLESKLFVLAAVFRGIMIFTMEEIQKIIKEPWKECNTGKILRRCNEHYIRLYPDFASAFNIFHYGGAQLDEHLVGTKLAKMLAAVEVYLNGKLMEYKEPMVGYRPLSTETEPRNDFMIGLARLAANELGMDWRGLARQLEFHSN